MEFKKNLTTNQINFDVILIILAQENEFTFLRLKICELNLINKIEGNITN